jgi:hypothetical protein
VDSLFTPHKTRSLDVGNLALPSWDEAYIIRVFSERSCSELPFVHLDDTLHFQQAVQTPRLRKVGSNVTWTS